MHRKLIRDFYPRWFERFERLNSQFLGILGQINKRSQLKGAELDRLMRYYSRMTRLLNALQQRITPVEIEEGKDDSKSLYKQVSYVMSQWDTVESDLSAIAWSDIPVERSYWLIDISERTLRHLNDYFLGNCMN